MQPVTPTPSAPSSTKKYPLPYTQAQVLRGHLGHVQCVRFNRNGQYCLSGGNDRSIRLWNPTKGTQIKVKVYKGHSYEVLDLDVSEDNSKFASVGEDKQPFLFDVATARILKRFRGHVSRINCVRFNADCSVFVTGSYDRSVKIWDMKANSIDAIQSLDDAKDSVSSIFLTGHEIVTGSIDGCVRRYDIRAGKLATDHVGHPVTCVSLSHDGNCILASTTDNTIRLFDKSSGELLSSYRGHVNSKYKIESSLTNSDAYIASGSEDHTICFWDLVEMTLVHTLRGHTGAVTGLSTSPVDLDGVTPMLSSSTDGTIRYWTA